VLLAQSATGAGDDRDLAVKSELCHGQHQPSVGAPISLGHSDT
jgi:hypothetical protein